MEFPHLGEQCSLTSCRQLDFLPFKCDGCKKTFCKLHFTSSNHECPVAHITDKVVPTCPLCSRPVPIPQGATADSEVTRHIDNNCDSEAARLKREKLKANRCAYKGCKSSDIVRVKCDKCYQSHCINHRHSHKCPGFPPAIGHDVSKQGAAAILRDQRTTGKQSSSSSSSSSYSNKKTNSFHPPSSHRPTAMQVHSLQQPGLSEEEALRKAIELSMQDSSHSQRLTEEEEEAMSAQARDDEALARALQEAEFAQRSPVTTSSYPTHPNKQTCTVS